MKNLYFFLKIPNYFKESAFNPAYAGPVEPGVPGVPLAPPDFQKTNTYVVTGIFKISMSTNDGTPEFCSFCWPWYVLDYNMKFSVNFWALRVNDNYVIILMI